MIFEDFNFVFALWGSHILFHIKRLRHTLVVSFSPHKAKKKDETVLHVLRGKSRDEAGAFHRE